MAPNTRAMLATALAALLSSTPVSGDSLKDIQHVVIFMQENRAFDTVCAASGRS